jgi:Transposase DDE domain
MKATTNLYCHYMMNTAINYTGTYLSEHHEELSHDSVTRFLRKSKLKPSMIWEEAKKVIVLSEQGYIIVDDTVLDKSYSRKIEGVKRQYSGNAHGLILGIGVVNLLYYNPELNRYWLIDIRIYDDPRDGKTKLDHVNEMLSLARERGVNYKTVLMDTWYATAQIMVRLNHEQTLFYCPIKVNRLVDDTGGKNPYKAVDKLEWTEQELKMGKTIKIWKTSKHMKVKLFRVTISTNRTDYIITNDVNQVSANEALKQSSIRWKIEQLHREEKQLTGIEKCQARKNRSQRNHIVCAALVWLFMSNAAHLQAITIYQYKNNLWKNYLTTQLKNQIPKFA